MKLLALSDLHMCCTSCTNHIYTFDDPHQIKQIQQLVQVSDCSVVVITGDIFESWNQIVHKDTFNPYIALQQIFGQYVTVICTLGNHEFFNLSVTEVLEFYTKQKNNFELFCDTEKQKNIFYLDIDNKVLVDNINFIGNVLWYDNTLKPNQSFKDDYIDSTWNDCTIKDFVPSQQCQKNLLKIKQNVSKDFCNILCTHMVPHHKLNWFTSNQPVSIYNQYSGCYDILTELNIDNNINWSFCGHTHRYIACEINNIFCVNCGNDYLTRGKFKYFLTDI